MRLTTLKEPSQKQLAYQDAPIAARQDTDAQSLQDMEVALKERMAGLPDPTPQGEAVDELIYSVQFDLESFQSGYGAHRYFKNINKNIEGASEAKTSYGQTIIRAAVVKVGDAIEEFCTPTAKRGGQSIAKVVLKKLDPHVTAMIALRCLVDHTTATQKFTRVCINLGTKIQDQLTFSQFQEASPKLFKMALDHQKGATSYRHLKNAMTYCMNKNEIKVEDRMTDPTLFHVGKKLIEIIIEQTGFFHIQKINTAKTKTVFEISPTQALLDWIEMQKQQKSTMMPLLLPTVAPPVAWVSSSGGGYHFPAFSGRYQVAKGTNQAWAEEFDEDIEHRQEVLKAINAIQATPWIINRKVLEVAQELWRVGNPLAKLPPRDALEMPRRPEDIETNEEARKKWKREASKTHEKNNKLAGKIMNVNQTFWIADFFKDAPAIYFPHQFDFRGRIYSIPAYLSPQSTDLSKGLLKFQEGVALETPEAARWLAVQGANCMGFDKVSFEEREAYIESISDEIIRVAENPLDNLWWADKDKVKEAFGFLAFCFEWAQYKKEGLSFKSHLPIALDATCSGIQHFSAMIRDEIGGKAVNLISGNRKADIYQQVCDLFIEKLKAELPNHSAFNQKNADKWPTKRSQYALWWLDLKPDRGFTKRQVMTFPYGAVQFSCREYTEEWLVDERSAVIPWPEEMTFEATRYATELLWASILEVVVGARAVMQWLQGLASGASKDNQVMHWETPVGFPVWQQYFVMNMKRLKTSLNDVKVVMGLPEPTDTLNSKRMRSSISPNFVHSMDAAHLTLTTNTLIYEDHLTNFAMIHDSFGVHARYTSRLSSVLRNEFVKMYEENDVLGGLYDHLGRQLEDDTFEKLEKPLERGGLALEVVKRDCSEFCVI